LSNKFSLWHRHLAGEGTELKPLPRAQVKPRCATHFGKRPISFIPFPAPPVRRAPAKSTAKITASFPKMIFSRE